MKLTKVRITEFQSILDSTEFEIGDVTCLVGKNEAGKTALLKALYRLNPIIEADGDFDPTDDYPRRAVSDYEDEIDAEKREPAVVIQATYELVKEEVAEIENVLGSDCLVDSPPTVILTKGYANTVEFCDLNVDCEAALNHLKCTAGLSSPVLEQLSGIRGCR